MVVEDGTERRPKTSSEHGSTNNDVKFYENVCLGSVCGRLKLTNDDICSQVNDGSRKVKLNWNQLAQTKISPSTGDKSVLQIVSNIDSAKELHFSDRGSLVQVQSCTQQRRSSSTEKSVPTSHLTSTTEANNTSDTPAKKKKLRKTKRPVVTFNVDNHDDNDDDDDCDVEQVRITRSDSEDPEFFPTLGTCNPSRWVHRNWVKATALARSGITRTIVAIAVHAATYPCLWIVLVLGISAALLATGLQSNFHMELDMLDIFTPTTSRFKPNRKWALDGSSPEGSKLPGYVATHVPLQIVIHAGGQNTISYEGVERVFDVWNVATSIEGVNHLCSESDELGVELKINLPAGYYGHCEFQAITGFWAHNQTKFEQEVPLNDDVTRFLLNDTYPDGTTVDVGRIFGNLEVHDDGMPISAEALFVEIAVPLNGKWLWDDFFNYTAELQIELADLRETWVSSDETDFVVEFAMGFNVAKEFQKTIFKDFPLLPIVFTIMLGFCCLVFWKRHRVQSRLLLALGSVCTVGLSLASGFGLMFILGVPFTVVTNILPYIVFGVGLDDTFIIYGALERTDSRKPVVERVREVFEEVGLSITMTTLTTSLAFGMGCISTVPAIRDLCFYAFPTVLIDGLYQVSFFVSLIALDERRIQANRLDCCPCVVASPDSRIDSDGSTDGSGSNEENDSIDNSQTHRTSVRRDTAKQAVDANENVPQTSRSAKFMGWFADQLMRPWVKIAVLLVFSGLFAVLAYSSTLLQQKFSPFDLLPSDSPTRAYLSSLENYGGVNGDVYLYFRGMNQSYSDVQDQMIDYIDQIVAIDHVELQPFCWVKDFRALMEDPDAFVEGLKADPTVARILEEYPKVSQFLESEAVLPAIDGMTFKQVMNLMFSQPSISQMYSYHVVKDENGDIYSSRCQVKLKGLDFNSVSDQVALLKAVNEVTENHPLNQNSTHEHAFLYKDMFHLWEFFDVAIQELQYTAVVGIATVTIFAFLFVPHWSAVFYVFPLMVVLYVNLLGLFQLFGLSINVLTYVTLVVSVGLLVDFLMHILLRYYESTKGTREERVKDTLTTMGASILLGGLSTFLGTIPLIFSQSAVIRTIYIAFFSMISLGISHGLVLLPVLLSIFGTTTTSTTGDSNNLRQEQDDMKVISAVKSYESDTRVKEDDDVKTQGSSSFSFSLPSSEQEDAPPESSFPTSLEILTTYTPPDCERIADYDYDHEIYSVAHVVEPSNTYDQFEVSVV